MYSTAVGTQHRARVVTTTDPALPIMELQHPFRYSPPFRHFLQTNHIHHMLSCIFQSSHDLLAVGLLCPLYRWRGWGTAPGSWSQDAQPGPPIPKPFASPPPVSPPLPTSSPFSLHPWCYCSNKHIPPWTPQTFHSSKWGSAEVPMLIFTNKGNNKG